MKRRVPSKLFRHSLFKKERETKRQLENGATPEDADLAGKKKMVEHIKKGMKARRPKGKLFNPKTPH